MNSGEVVFAVLNGIVDTRFKMAGIEHVFILDVSHVFVAECGCEHVAHLSGEARILVVESEGSV